MKTEFHGLDEMMAELQKLERDTEQSKKEALIAGGEVMQEATKKLSPVRTGKLQSHIELSDVEKDEIEVYVDNQGNAYYGHMLEFGTSKMRARPFMGPAFNQNRRAIKQAMATSIRNKLRSFV